MHEKVDPALAKGPGGREKAFGKSGSRSEGEARSGRRRSRNGSRRRN